MKTYVVQTDKDTPLAVMSLVDNMLRAFYLAIESVSAFKWRNVYVGNQPGTRWFDTNSPLAAATLKMELSNYGISVIEQPAMVPGDEWDKANLIER